MKYMIVTVSDDADLRKEAAADITADYVKVEGGSIVFYQSSEYSHKADKVIAIYPSDKIAIRQIE